MDFCTRIYTACDMNTYTMMLSSLLCVSVSHSGQLFALQNHSLTWQWPSCRSIHDETTTTCPRMFTTIRKLSVSRISVLIMSSSTLCSCCDLPNTAHTAPGQDCGWKNDVVFLNYPVALTILQAQSVRRVTQHSRLVDASRRIAHMRHVHR